MLRHYMPHGVSFNQKNATLPERSVNVANQRMNVTAYAQRNVLKRTHLDNGRQAGERFLVLSERSLRALELLGNR